MKWLSMRENRVARRGDDATGCEWTESLNEAVDADTHLELLASDLERIVGELPDGWEREPNNWLRHTVTSIAAHEAETHIGIIDGDPESLLTVATTAEALAVISLLQWFVEKRKAMAGAE